MRKLSTFFHVLRHSLFPTNDYYHKIRKSTPFVFSLKYLMALVTLLSVMLVLLFPLRFFPIYSPVKLQEQTMEVLNQFPNELVVSVNETGTLTSNYNRPLIIFSQFTNVPEKLVVIDPLATDDMIDDYDAYVLLMRKKAVVKSFDGEIVIDYHSSQPFIFNYQSAQNVKSVLNAFFDNYWIFMATLFLLALIVVPVIFNISKLVYIAIASLLVYLVVRTFFVKRLMLKKAYQIGLHASTAPIILEYIILMFDISIPVKIWFFILTIVFIAGAIYEAYMIKKES